MRSEGLLLRAFLFYANKIAFRDCRAIRIAVFTAQVKTLLIPLLLLSGALHAEPRSHILEPVESAPKEIDGLEFSVVTQAEWKTTKSTLGDEITVQLRIKNKGTKPLVFATFDSFSMVLTGPDGKDIPMAGARDATRITPNLLLQPGREICYPLNARVSFDKKNPGGAALELQDGTGTVWFGSLKAGVYSLKAAVAPSPFDFSKETNIPAPLWAGKGTSEPVTFKVATPAAH